MLRFENFVKHCQLIKVIIRKYLEKLPENIGELGISYRSIPCKASFKKLVFLKTCNK